MDNHKIGRLIYTLRNEKKLTQKQLGELIGVSDKAVSKWECGQGAPDVSLWEGLSQVLEADIERILAGDLKTNDIDGGNMRRLRIYVCPLCKNTLTATTGNDISCCGRKLTPLVAWEGDDAHQVRIQMVEDDYYVTFPHEMTKEHYITFMAYVTYDRMTMVKLYPEQNGEVRFPKGSRGKLYYHCSKHGLKVADLY